MFSTLKDFEDAFARALTAEEVERLAVAFDTRKEYLPAYQQAQFSRRLAQLRLTQRDALALPSFNVAAKPTPVSTAASPSPLHYSNEIVENGSYVFDGVKEDLQLPGTVVSNLTIRNMHGRRVQCSPCLNSLYIEDCSDLVLHGIAHQVRCSRVSKSKLYLFSGSPVAMEDCEGVEIHEQTGDLPAKFVGLPNRASEVIDFSL